MTNDDVDHGRRLWLQGAFIAGATLIGQNVVNDTYAYVKGLPIWDTGDIALPKKLEYLFGDSAAETGIVPPGINRHLAKAGVPLPSKYIATAFNISSGLQSKATGVKNFLEVTPSDPRMNAANDRNILVLGGPVATPYTAAMFGYKDFICTKERGTIPLIDEHCPLPYYFYTGNENGYGYFGEEKRFVKRWLEDGQVRELAMYGIFDKEANRIIEQPTRAGWAAGDMLMLARVPNPENISGTMTLIGGLHGYSLMSFFADIEQSLSLVQSIIGVDKYDFFQALIPYKLDENGTAKIDLIGADEWRIRVSAVEAKSLINYFSQQPIDNT